MPSRAHTIWNIQATLTLPILWSFTALLLAMIIPPPSLNTQLQPVYHHSPRADIDATGAGRTALILTAHPDDEAMFFSPTIMGLKNHGWEVRGLCLSTGNAEGLGAERVEELKRSYGVFGLQESHVKWLNDSSFPDNMGAVWRSEDVQRAVSEYLSDQPADVIVTFDKHGISAHPNHASLSSFRPAPSSTHPTMLYHLNTPSILKKYSGPLNPVFRRGYYQLAKGMSEWADLFDVKLPVKADFSVTSSGTDWIRSVRAMREHKSQMTWYRYGWLASSGLMWANDLTLVV